MKLLGLQGQNNRIVQKQNKRLNMNTQQNIRKENDGGLKGIRVTF